MPPAYFDCVVRTNGCYIGIFDCAAAIHREETLSTIVARAQAEADTAGEPWSAIFRMNERCAEWTRRRDILVWIVLFDGAFRARIRVLADDETFSSKEMDSSSFIGGEFYELNCPSGRIAVASLHHLGNSDLRPTFEVASGLYHVGLARDEQQESDHMFWEDHIEYPPDAGPDWILTLKRVASAVDRYTARCPPI